MGQRLVVSVCKDGSEFATVYYHWSAYTICALQECSNLLSRYWIECGKYPKKSPAINLIHAVESLKYSEREVLLFNNVSDKTDHRLYHGGIDSSDTEYVHSHFSDETFLSGEYLDRNLGLIALSSENRKQLHQYEEGSIKTDLDSRTVSSDVFNLVGTAKDGIFDELKDFYKNYEAVDLPYDMTHLSFDKIDEVIGFLSKCNGKLLRTKDGLLYEMVE